MGKYIQVMVVLGCRLTHMVDNSSIDTTALKDSRYQTARVVKCLVQLKRGIPTYEFDPCSSGHHFG